MIYPIYSHTHALSRLILFAIAAKYECRIVDGCAGFVLAVQPALCSISKIEIELAGPAIGVSKAGTKSVIDCN